MLARPEALLASPIPDLVPLRDRREPLKAVISSLAHGGAERIVLEWLGEEARRGRAVELAVIHPRADGWRSPRGVVSLARGPGSPVAFMGTLARRWQGTAAPVAAHLVGDDLLEVLWRAGIPTIPTVHNARAGWRNDPSRWRPSDVPLALACAHAVRGEMLAAGCSPPVVAIRHVPSSPRGACDPLQRERVRVAWGIGPGTLLVGAVGAFKPQKDFPRAVEILCALRRLRDAELMILGGVLDARQLAELERTIDRTAVLELAGRVKLPGFVDAIGPYYAACDVLLQASRFEGLSMAAREALACGLPVVALDVGGQSEIAHPGLELLPPVTGDDAIATALARHAPRRELRAEPAVRAPRIWSLAHAHRRTRQRRLDTLFVTANLNAGGAQRSLVNLARALAGRHRFAVAVCGETTQGAFAAALREAGVEMHRPAPVPDPFAVAESLLANAAETGAATLCFWNADARVKLLVAKFAPSALRLVDASPGAYAFAELEGEGAFARSITYSVSEYYERLDVLVLKHRAWAHPARGAVRVIGNGVALRRADFRAPGIARFLVSGRIAPSKRLEIVIDAFESFARRDATAELHVVGQAEPRHTAYLAQVMERARDLPVRFRGAGASLDHLDEAFTAAIVLGTHQGCPNAVLEAMAASIPVVANASGGTGELVVDGETGWLLEESAAPAALAAAMSQCAGDDAHARRLAANARARVARDYSIEAMAAAYLECFAGAAA